MSVSRMDELEAGLAAEFRELRGLVQEREKQALALDIDLAPLERDAEAAMARAADLALDNLADRILKMAPALGQVTRQLRWSGRLWAFSLILWMLLGLVVTGALLYQTWFLDQYIPKLEHIELILDGMKYQQTQP